MGDAVRAANAYLSLSRFEDECSRTLAARKEVVMNPSAFSFATVPNISLIGYLMDAVPEWAELVEPV